MKIRFGKTGYWSITLIVICALIFICANLIAYLGACSYDDIPNTWSCVHSWATSYMYDFDLLTLLAAYPAAFLGIVLGLISLIRGAWYARK
jgi:uncharacterized membrane protein YoaT (DUF817 family)